MKRLDSLLSILKERARIRKHNRLFAGCLKTSAMLDYIDHKLTEEEVEVVKKHLRNCRHCAEEVKLMRKTRPVKKRIERTLYNDELL